MKKNNTTLPILWGAAIITLIIGLLLSIRTLGGIGRTTEIWNKKTNEFQELMALREIAAMHRSLLKRYAQFPATPAPLEELARQAVPGLSLITRTTETQPSASGWTTRKVSIGITDITGDDLGRFLEALSAATPPWATLVPA